MCNARGQWKILWERHRAEALIHNCSKRRSKRLPTWEIQKTYFRDDGLSFVRRRRLIGVLNRRPVIDGQGWRFLRDESSEQPEETRWIFGVQFVAAAGEPLNRTRWRGTHAAIVSLNAIGVTGSRSPAT